MTSPSPRSPSHPPRVRVRVSSYLNWEKSIFTGLASATRNKSCPICLSRIEVHKSAVIRICKHVYCIECIRKWSELKRNCPLCNAKFHSWFFNINFSTEKFEVERLPEINTRKDKKESSSGSGSRLRRSESYRSVLRLLRRTRNERHGVRSNTQFPWRRSFGGERALQWRSSIYSRRLRARPFPSEEIFKQNRLGFNNYAKERIQKRLEPWIRRELQAAIGDSDPSIIVHLAMSLWVLSFEEKLKRDRSERLDVEDELVNQLRPFLDDRTDMFWHELRCFAENSFTMETYDSLVEYEELD